MKIRVIGAAVALVLAVIGTIGVVGYVSGADARALAGTKTDDVLVVTKDIAKGTPSEKLTESVSVEPVPAKVVPADHVSSLKELRGKVAAVDLKSGEQVLGSRFTDPKTLAEEEGAGGVAVPKGMQEVTVQLEPTRVLGGQLQPGDEVGVFISWKDKNGTGYTHLVFSKVLVTGVQGGATKGDGGKSASAPQEAVLVTLARKAPDAERIVWASEFGTLWLSKQPEEASPKGSRIWTQKEIYR